MKSHNYRIDWRIVRREVLPMLLFVSVFAVVLRVWSITHPGARAAAEPLPMETIVAYKWELASLTPADLLLVGDSSCLMDVDAPELELHLARMGGKPISAVNLGVVSFIQMDSFGELIDRSIATSRGRLKRVVLLLHPEMLRREKQRSVTLNEKEIYPSLNPNTQTVREKILYWLGLETFERVTLWRYLPYPQPNQWGAFYGFQTGVRNYLKKHKGTAVEATVFRGGRAKSNFVASEDVLSEARSLRQRFPADVQLIIGLMPTAETFVGPNFQAEYEEMRNRWAQAIQPDLVLTNLPATLPDSFFATHTHLTRSGQRAFTRWLAKEIQATQQHPLQ